LDRELPNIELPKSFLDWSYRGAKLERVYVFPLTNVLGEIKGFQFRYVERDRKGYTDYITNTGEAVLFGLREATPHIWTSGAVLPVEGPFDLFPIQRHIPFTVATLTAHVSEPFLRLCRRMCKHIIFGYDTDETGRKATYAFKKEHSDEFKVSELKYPRLPMPDGKLTKDPGDLWELWGDTRIGEFLKSNHISTEMQHG